jgi:hypothetical protein
MCRMLLHVWEWVFCFVSMLIWDLKLSDTQILTSMYPTWSTFGVDFIWRYCELFIFILFLSDLMGSWWSHVVGRLMKEYPLYTYLRSPINLHCWVLLIYVLSSICKGWMWVGNCVGRFSFSKGTSLMIGCMDPWLAVIKHQRTSFDS